MMSVNLRLSVCPHSNEGMHMHDLDIFMLFQNHDNKTSLESSEFRFLLLKRLPGSRPSESESGGLKCYILASHLAKEAF